MPVTRPSSRSAARSLQRGAGVLAATVLTLGAFAGLVGSCANESAPSPTATEPPPATTTPTAVVSPTATASTTATPAPTQSARGSASPAPTADGGEATGGLGLGDAIERLPWVRDGLEGRERNAAFLLKSIGDASPPVLEALLSVEREFLPPGSAHDVAILEHLLPLALANSDLASRAVDVVLARRQGEDAVAWFSLALHFEGRAPYLIVYDIEDLRLAVRQGTADEGLVDNHLLYFEVQNPEAFRAIATLPWGADPGATTRSESGLVLFQVALTAPALFDAITETTWTEDGLDSFETSAIEDLLDMFTDPEASLQGDVLRLMRASFLDNVSAADALALRSLILVKGWGRSHLREVLSHPVLSGDIGDGEAYRLAMLDVALGGRPTPEKIDAILRDENFSTETRDIVLPSGKQLALVGISTGDNLETGLDTLEYVVREVERLMGIDFPRDVLYLLTADEYFPYWAGYTAGRVIGRPSLHTDRETMAHEVAHAYWATPPIWLREGAADFLATIIHYQDQDLGPDAPSIFDRGKCEEVANIEEMDTSGEYGCPYVLGLGVFGELFERLDREVFWEGFRRLQRLVETDGPRYIRLAGDPSPSFDSCPGEQRGFCYLRVAFADSADPRNAATAEEVITRWYYGTPHEDYGR